MSTFGITTQAIRSIFAYSSTPLTWISSLGIFLSIGSIMAIVGLAIFWLVSGVPFPGFGSIIGVIVLGFSITMLCIGILAQYLGLIYEEVKNRPLYLVTEESKPNL